MTRHIVMLLTVLGLLGSAWGQTTDTGKLISEAIEAADNALVLVEITYLGDTGEKTATGMGVCYDSDKGEFFALLASGQLRKDKIRGVRLILPGPERKSVTGEFMGMRPAAGIVFVRALPGQQSFKAVRLAGKSNLTAGQQVVSVGLMPGDGASTPYVGVGYVSSKLRVPEQLFYVTGGRLTCKGSPVFAAGGSMVGIVARALFLDYQMMSSAGQTNLAIKGLQESSFFLPIEEFAYAFKDVPQDGSIRRSPWIGSIKIIGVSRQQADLMSLDKPAVMVDRIIPGSPAAAAGLKASDAIVAIDGKSFETMANPELVAADFVRQVHRMSVGQDITLTVIRAGQTVDLKLRLAAMPMGPDEADRYINEKLGFGVRDKVALDQHMTTSPIALIPGLLVLGTSPRGPAANAGLRAGDVISAVGRQKIGTVAAFRQIVSDSLSADPTKAILLMIHREGEKPQAISIHPPSSASSDLFNSPFGGGR